jgi:tRNA(Ile)-lysidine synthase
MRIEKKLIEQIELANRRHGLFSAKDSLVVGASGGPDSTALLFLLSKLKRKYDLKINAAHLNHGLLKKEARRYAVLAEKTARVLSVPFYSKTINLRALAKKNKHSLEDEGRIERYRFFESVARQTRSTKIVTAHTLDDQAETVILRILRGSGLRGLKAIAFKRPQGRHFQVIRPLLGAQKKDLLVFLEKSKIPYCLDPTNQSQDFTRNRVRHKLLPMMMRDFNPNIKQRLSSLGLVCGQAQDCLEQISQKAFTQCRRKNYLRIDRLKKLHPAIAKEVIFQALIEKRGDLKRLAHDHIEAVWDLVKSKEKRLERQLPGFLTAKKISDKLYFVL